MTPTETEIHQLLLQQQKTIRRLQLELEALKRMFFEHRPPFVQAFAHHSEALESSGYLRQTDDTIRQLERRVEDSRKQ